jgi:hypothetical protein
VKNCFFNPRNSYSAPSRITRPAGLISNYCAYNSRTDGSRTTENDRGRMPSHLTHQNLLISYDNFYTMPRMAERTVNPVGRPPGTQKTGGQKKGGIKTQTVAVKEAVLRVFHDLNKGDAYLRDIAENDPKLFMSLLARLIPSETNATVELNQTHVIDLGAAMRQANERLARTVIEHRPAVPMPVLAAPDIAAQRGGRELLQSAQARTDTAQDL